MTFILAVVLSSWNPLPPTAGDLRAAITAICQAPVLLGTTRRDPSSRDDMCLSSQRAAARAIRHRTSHNAEQRAVRRACATRWAHDFRRWNWCETATSVWNGRR